MPNQANPSEFDEKFTKFEGFFTIHEVNWVISRNFCQRSKNVLDSSGMEKSNILVIPLLPFTIKKPSLFWQIEKTKKEAFFVRISSNLTLQSSHLISRKICLLTSKIDAKIRKLLQMFIYAEKHFCPFCFCFYFCFETEI